MKPKKLLALALALALLLIGTGVFADAQSTEATPQDGSAAEQKTVETEGVSDTLIPGQDEAAEETPAAEATAEPTNEATAEPTDEAAAAPTDDSQEATAEPTDEATAEPTDDSQEATAEPEEIPAAESTDKPTAEPKIEETDYAYVSKETVLYRDVNCTDKLGQPIDGETVMLVYEVAASESGTLYEAYFDTEKSLETSECEHVYFFSSSPLKRLTKEELAAFAVDAASYREIEQRAVYTAEVAYAAAGEPEEMPTVSHVSKTNVNLRSEPSRMSESVATLQKGDLIEATGKVVNEEGETWYAITCNGVSGYVRSDLVTVFEDVPEIDSDSAQEEPAEEPTQEPTEEQPVQEPTEEPIAPVRSVVVEFAYDTETLQLGSQITLTAYLEGYEGMDYTCRWEYATANSDGTISDEWQDAQNDALSFTYELTEENLLTAWRMCVTVND